ncbi:MAG: LuxR C-terminal-related transcriptional regulator [Aliishimia sp.]
MSAIKLTAHEISDLIGTVYDSSMERNQFHGLIDRLVDHFPGIAAMVIGQENLMLTPIYSATLDVPEKHQTPSSLIEDYSDPTTTHHIAYARAPAGYVDSSLKFIPRDKYEKSTVYQENLKPLGLGQFISTKIALVGDKGASLSIALPDTREAEERLHDELFELMTLLAPHLVRAHEVARAIVLSRNSAKAIGGFLDVIIVPMLVVNADGKFIFANASGQRFLNRSDALFVDPAGRLTAAENHVDKALSKKLSDMDQGLAVEGMRMTDGDANLSLCMVPFRSSFSDLNQIDQDMLHSENLYAIFFGQRTSDNISHHLLRDMFQLSSKEAEVCVSLLNGNSVSELAAATDRSEKTVRNQIQSIYAKVQVNSFGELMQALSIFTIVGTMFPQPAE